MSSLPFELVQTVIGFVQHDIMTLKSSSLTSRFWNAASRAYILRQVTLSSEQQLVALEDLLEGDPDLARHIRKIRVFLSTRHSHESTQAPWIQHLALSFPSKLFNLSELEISGLYDDGRYCNAEFFKNLSQFTTVTKLTLEDNRLPLSVVLAFTSSFPNLQQLALFNLPHVTQTPRCIASNLSPTFLPQLKRLKLHPSSDSSVEDGVNDRIIDFLFSSGSLNNLESVSLVILPFGQASIGRFILDTRHSLKHIQLHIPVRLSDLTIGTSLGLEECSNLESLTLYVTGNRRLCSQVMASILLILESKSLRRISLHLSFQDSNPALEYASLISALDDPRFENIQEVELVYEGGLDLRLADVKIRKAFKTLNDKANLSVDCSCRHACIQHSTGYHRTIGNAK
ncbi:hypothetical protein ABKN59_009109 [Abortiporus biennis]